MYNTQIIYPNRSGLFTTSYIDEYGKPVERTRDKYPYSYDGYVTYRNGDNSEVNSTVYTDRLLQWDYKKARNLMKVHFGESGDYWDNRSPDKIQAFLRDWNDDPKLKLVLIMQYCNVSNGYPTWRLDYTSFK